METSPIDALLIMTKPEDLNILIELYSGLIPTCCAWKLINRPRRLRRRRPWGPCCVSFSSAS